jgi:hypothetical protein
MADKKISALTASAVPLSGSEVLPIVQSGSTVKVSVANLTAGRAVSALSMSLTTPMGTSSGGTGLGAFTANGVTYASSTSALATSPNFTYDGTSLRVNAIVYAINSFGSVGALQSTAGPGFRWTLSNDSTWRLQYTPDGFSSATEVMKVDSSANVTVSTAGKGLTLTSPNGAVTKTLTIDNAGNIALI